MAASTAVDRGLETFDEEPHWQPHFKEDPRHREHEADVDPDDFSDHSHHQTHVADQTANCQEAGDKPRPEQQRTQEQASNSERCLADGVGDGVPLGQQ